jgi:hypothetical protein
MTATFAQELPMPKVLVLHYSSHGVSPTGRKIHFDMVDAKRVHNGKIIGRWDVANLLSVMQQLGALSADKKGAMS